MRLTIAELKHRLRQLGVDTSNVVEKRELQDLLRRHSRDPSSQRVRVQVHMEVLQLPSLLSGRSVLDAIAQSQSHTQTSAGAASAHATQASQVVFAMPAPTPVLTTPAAVPSATGVAVPTVVTSTPTVAGSAAATPAPVVGRRRPRDSVSSAPSNEPRATRQRTRRQGGL